MYLFIMFSLESKIIFLVLWIISIIAIALFLIIVEFIHSKLEEQQQLADYEQYTQSQQYIEEVAKSKLGLVYNNEIVFKEQDTEDGK